MESDIRAKAPPGPSLASAPGPFPEMPGREKAEGERGLFGEPVHPAPKVLETGRKRQSVYDTPQSLALGSSSALSYLCAS